MDAPPAKGASGEERLQAEAAKKLLFMRIMDQGARRRMNNIRVANQGFADQVEGAILRLIQSGRVRIVDEGTLISIINQMRGEKRETRITRK